MPRMPGLGSWCSGSLIKVDFLSQGAWYVSFSAWREFWSLGERKTPREHRCVVRGEAEEEEDLSQVAACPLEREKIMEESCFERA